MTFTTEELLEDLKSRADTYGISYSANIGLDKLQARINEHIANLEQVAEPVVARKTSAQLIDEQRAQAGLLKRVMITCKNPDKVLMGCQEFNVGNSVVGSFQKVIAFDSPTHVPHILLEYIRDQKCTIFKATKGAGGIDDSTAVRINEFVVTELPALTGQELLDLAEVQRSNTHGSSEAQDAINKSL